MNAKLRRTIAGVKIMAQAAETRKSDKAPGKASRAKAAGRGSVKPSDPAVDRDQLLQAYRTMLLIRRFEEKAGQLYGMQLIGGFCHLYIGQEAVGTGMEMDISEGDEVIKSSR